MQISRRNIDQLQSESLNAHNYPVTLEPWTLHAAIYSREKNIRFHGCYVESSGIGSSLRIAMQV